MLPILLASNGSRPALASPAARILTAFGAVVVGSLLLTLSAKTQVPFWPVPMTMQTCVIVLLGLTLGPRLGMAAVAFYLAQGAFGLPVFAGTPEKGLGLAYMAGPTGGYLVGFLAAAGVAGWLAAKVRHPLALFAVALFATALIFVPGVAYLATLIGWEQAFAAGALPFLPGAVVKSALAVALAIGLSRLVGSWSR
ncbi:MAG: biotin transporter BioY [Pseudomonadota bacterium]